MSRRGNCLDNAAMENSFSSLQSKLGGGLEGMAAADEVATHRKWGKPREDAGHVWRTWMSDLNASVDRRLTREQVK